MNFFLTSRISNTFFFLSFIYGYLGVDVGIGLGIGLGIGKDIGNSYVLKKYLNEEQKVIKVLRWAEKVDLKNPKRVNQANY